MEQSQYPQLQLLAVLQKKQAAISAAMNVLNDGFTNGLMNDKSERTHYAHALLVTNPLMDIGPKSGSAEDLAAVPAGDIVQLSDYLDNVARSIDMWVNDPKFSEADLLKQLADNVQRHGYGRQLSGLGLLGENAYDIAKAKSTELDTLIPAIQAQLPAPAPAPLFWYSCRSQRTCPFASSAARSAFSATSFVRISSVLRLAGQP